MNGRSLFLRFRSLSTFFIVGIAGAFAYVILSSVLTTIIGLAYIASIISYCVLIPIVYSAQRTFTFRSVANHRVVFPKYVATQLIGLSISGVLPYILRGIAQKSPIVVFVLVAMVVPIANFVLLRFWAFK
jgi:putative flippase GtrA